LGGIKLRPVCVNVRNSLWKSYAASVLQLSVIAWACYDFSESQYKNYYLQTACCCSALVTLFGCLMMSWLWVPTIGPQR
jgi:hypothetical protein